MVTIVINKQEYQLYTNWQEVTIAQAVRLQALDMPERLKELIVTGTDNVTNHDLLKTFPDYFGKVLYVLSNVPMEVINYIHASDRMALYSNYFRDMVAQLLLMTTNVGELPDSFEFKGERYYLPASEHVFGKELPLYSMNAYTFSEMADLQLTVQDVADNGMKAAAMLVAVATRKAGEAYSEAVALQRAKEFGELPMVVFWQVFFSFREVLKKSLTLSLKHLASQTEEARERLNKLTAQHSVHNSMKSHGHRWLARFNRLNCCRFIPFMKSLWSKGDTSKNRELIKEEMI